MIGLQSSVGKLLTGHNDGKGQANSEVTMHCLTTLHLVSSGPQKRVIRIKVLVLKRKVEFKKKHSQSYIITPQEGKVLYTYESDIIFRYHKRKKRQELLKHLVLKNFTEKCSVFLKISQHKNSCFEMISIASF